MELCSFLIFLLILCIFILDILKLFMKYPEKKRIPDIGMSMTIGGREVQEDQIGMSLYFPDEDERNAIAVNCIRQNGAVCSDMSDTSKRALATTEGKRLYFEPDVVGLDIKNSGHAMSLEDAKSISFKSGTALSIWAVEGIELSAQKVTVKTPGALNILRNPDS